MKPMLDKICLVIIGDTLEEFLAHLEQGQKKAEFIELRLDYIQDLTPSDLKQIRKHTYKKAIACIRSEAEGGKFKGDRTQQQELLQIANELEFDYLDIDLALADSITINNNKSKIILSYHDFKQTPSLEELNQLTEQMLLYSPNVIKFAVFANSEADTKLLMQYLINNADNFPLIALAMGEQGKLLRILSPLLGGFLTFACLKQQTSAPGQLEFDTLNSLYTQVSDQ